jgi:hypothetical protein
MYSDTNFELFLNAFCFFFASSPSLSTSAAASRSGKIRGAKTGSSDSLWDFAAAVFAALLHLAAHAFGGNGGGDAVGDIGWSGGEGGAFGGFVGDEEGVEAVGVEEVGVYFHEEVIYSIRRV